MNKLTHFSLFSGIGGIDLAAEWAGFTTVGQCEWADYPTKVLEKHWPCVPRWRDVRDVTAENFYKKTGLRTVNLVSGGFPCQPFSVAGKRRGKKDDRYLWPEMFRVISELRPTWVLGENVAGFISMGLDDAISDLESEGYEVQSFLIPACAVGAPHQRNRVFIVAWNSNGRNRNKGPLKEMEKGQNPQPTGVCANVAHTGCTLRQGELHKRIYGKQNRARDANKAKRPSCTPRTNVADTSGKRQQARGCQEPTGREVACRYNDAANTHGSGCEEFYPTQKPKRERHDSGDIAEGGGVLGS